MYRYVYVVGGGGHRADSRVRPVWGKLGRGTRSDNQGGGGAAFTNATLPLARPLPSHVRILYNRVWKPFSPIFAKETDECVIIITLGKKKNRERKYSAS